MGGMAIGWNALGGGIGKHWVKGISNPFPKALATHRPFPTLKRVSKAEHI
jgi:hypothetical protein